MNVSIITIGDEILIGQVIDTNSAWMAGLLNEAGFAVREILSVADENEEIKDALQRSLSKSHVVLVTGGLGPTDDDLTMEALCGYFGVEAVFH
ncbi:MAG TPA: molybdopterin-binding protein, partial [Saprospiraceae bacterium]|nr:molybdopterin-binding protein [Saprospiraceae bacterium]